MNLSIIGVGLIGGSIALKLREKNFVTKVYGIDSSEENLQQAIELNIIDEKSTFEEGVVSADIIVLAVPVDVSVKLLPKILDLIKNHQTVVDVGSTKEGITEAVKNHVNRSLFVAFHPMWGTENNGPKSAVADSFTGKAAVICNREDSAENALSTVKSLTNALDMHTIYMDAHAHDVHTAYISHISHITSYALANTVLEKEKEEETIFQLASSGFSSTVRLAKSHPEMWVPIFAQNRENVLDVLNEHITQLRKFKAALEKENYDYLGELIGNANKIRSILEK